MLWVGVVNTVPKRNEFSSNSGFPLNIPTADKFKPKIPFGTQLKKWMLKLQAEKNKTPTLCIDVDRMALAKKFAVASSKTTTLRKCCGTTERPRP
jgi:hypothetical protein